MTEGIKTEEKPMIDHVAWAKVIVDTEPDKDGWCFCRPANHPEDIELRGYEEWSDTSQFFGGVVASPSYAEGYKAALRAIELEYERQGEDPLYAMQVADRMRKLLRELA